MVTGCEWVGPSFDVNVVNVNRDIFTMVGIRADHSLITKADVY